VLLLLMMVLLLRIVMMVSLVRIGVKVVGLGFVCGVLSVATKFISVVSNLKLASS
jgi:hypothetical protein